ncbi:MAG: MotA/TolQ/ExbB proton channel family protein [Nitrospiria bacterium]
MKKSFLLLFTLLFLPLLFLHGLGYAADPPASLDELLDQVRNERANALKANTKREAQFLAERNTQSRLLKEARARLAVEEARSVRLKKKFEKNEKMLALLETRLKKETGSLGELFGVVRQNAREAEGLFDSSLISTQRPGRGEFVGFLSKRKELPTIKEMERLWFLLQDEMTESGKVVQFSSPIVTRDGKETERKVTRVGAFNAISEGKYLHYLPETKKLVELNRQPARRFLEMAGGLESAKGGVVSMAVDPSRGALLSLLVQSPDTLERIQQGGIIGYFILAIGGIALLLVCERFAYLTFVGKRIVKQMKQEVPGLNNALGRIMHVYTEDPDQDVETLGHRLDEATLKEIPKLERGLTTIAILAAVAPLMGLLGTVTGMIETFQSITLFGAGDPKLMSGGISQALVTTELGLVVAIPIVLLHSFIHGKSNNLVQILDEQSAGMVARLSERQHRDGLA